MIYELLRMEYILPDNSDTPRILLWARDEDRKLEVFGVDYIPNLYTDIDQEIPSSPYIKKVYGEYKSLNGKMVKKVDVKCFPNEPLSKIMTNLRKLFNDNTFESHVLLSRRTLIDLGIMDCFTVKDGILTPVKSDLTIPPRISFLDIETNPYPEDELSLDNPIQNVVCLTLYDSYIKKIIANVYHPSFKVPSIEVKNISVKTKYGIDKFEVMVYKHTSEVNLLNSFVDYIRDTDPDLLSGWYSSGYYDKKARKWAEGFDIPYLINRLKKLGINKNRLSPINQTYITYDKRSIIKGRVLFDLLESYRVQQRTIAELESWKLSFVVEHELGLKGLVPDKKSFIREMWERCYDEKTEVLTKEGWKYFRNITYDDEIATLNQKTFKLEYQRPSEIQNFNHEGDMFKINSEKMDLLVTPNHKLFMAGTYPHCHKYNPRYNSNPNSFYKLKEAKTISNKKFWCKQNFEWEGKEKEYFVLPEIEKKTWKRKQISIIKMDDWLEFLGYYISEGSLEKPYRVYVTQSRSKKEGKKKIVDCIKRLGFYCYTNDNMDNIRIISKQLVSYFENLKLEGSHNQFIPREFLMLSKRQLKILYDALLFGDGHIEPSGKEYLYTVSEKLAGDYQEIILKLGYGASIFMARPDPYFRISRNIEYLPEVKRKHISHEYYKGKVYCVSVPNEIIYVRRNRKTIWCGNSPISLLQLNVLDVVAIVLLDKYKQIISRWNQIRKIAGCHFDDLLLYSRVIHILALRFAKGKYVLPDKFTKEDNIYGKYKGAYVKEPVIGTHNWVINFDFKSMYPNILRHFNISPETIDEKGEIKIECVLRLKKDDKEITKIVGFKQKPRGLFPTILDYLNKERNISKKRLREATNKDERLLFYIQDRSYKFLVNSAIGVLGSRYYSLYHPYLGACVSAVGRKLIKHGEEIFTKRGYKVINADTDNLHIISRATNKEDCLKEAKELHPFLDRSIKEFVKNKWGIDNPLETELSTIYRSIFFKPVRETNRTKKAKGAKKAFGARIVWENDKFTERTEIKGLETKKSDSSTLSRKAQRVLLEMALDNKPREELITYVKRVIDDYKNNNLMEIAVPKGISSPFSSYARPPAVVRGSVYSNTNFHTGIKSGSKVRYLYVDEVKGYPPTDVISFEDLSMIPIDKVRVNYDKMFEKTVRHKLECVLDALGIGWINEGFPIWPKKKLRALKAYEAIKQYKRGQKIMESFMGMK